MPNLIEGIQSECNRIREVCKLYEEIGLAGKIGLALLQLDIKKGEDAIASGDIVEMVRVCAYLKEQGKS